MRTSQKKTFKGGIDLGICKLKRQSETITLRKTKRDNILMKRRGMPPETEINFNESNNDVSAMAEKLSSDNLDEVYESVTFFQKKISTDPSFTRMVIMLDIIPKITSYLYFYAKPDIQLQSAWIMTNIAASEENYFESIRITINPLIQLFIISPHETIREQAIWALSNIMSENDISDYIKQSELSKHLSKYLLSTNNLSFSKTGIWALCNIIRSEKITDHNVAYIFDIIKRYIFIRNEEVLSMIFWILGIITKDGEYNEYLFEYKIFNVLIKFLNSSSSKTSILNSVKILGNIIALENKDHVRKIIDCGFFLKLKELILDDNFRVYLKEFFWILSNITADDEIYIGPIIQHKFLELIPIENIRDVETKKEILWVVLNIVTKRKSEYNDYILNCGFFQFLKSAMKNLEYQKLSLEILSKVSSIQKIDEDYIEILEEVLLESNDENVCTMVRKLIES